MDFKINNIKFGANYQVYGKQTADKTHDVYESAISKLEKQRKIAIQAQEYFETPEVQNLMEYLPQDTFVRLHTGIIDRHGKKEDEILDFMPFVSFETPSINEQINISRELNGKDALELSLNDMDVLDKKPIIGFFANLINFYNTQK